MPMQQMMIAETRDAPERQYDTTDVRTLESCTAGTNKLFV
jgi:hypothetical protein